MITKALIKSIDFSSNTCVVRIPLFEGSGNINEVTFPATFAITPGIYNSYKAGDIVQVAFENGELNNPVVIGKLYVSANNEKDSYRGAISCDSLNVSSQATLPLETKLSSNPGDKTSVNVKGGYNAIKSLKDIILNIQDLNKQMVSQDIKNDNLYLSKNLNGDYTGLGWNLTDKAWTITSYDSDRKPITLMKVDNGGVTVPNLKVTGYPKEIIYRFKQIDTNNKEVFTEKDYFTIIESGIEYTYLKYPKFYKNGEEITDYNSLTIEDIINNGWKTLSELDKNQDYLNIPEFKQNYLTWQISYTTTYSLQEDNSLLETLLADTIKITLLDNGGTGYLVQNSESTGIKSLEENKSKCYYLDKDPNETNDIKLGDCWFNTSKTPIEITITEGTESGDETIIYTCPGGTLYQWNGTKWEDVGGSIVANKVTAGFIDTLNISAKAMDIRTTSNNKILFAANGLNNGEILDENDTVIKDSTGKNVKVRIGNFNIEEDSQALVIESKNTTNSLSATAFTKLAAGELHIQSKNTSSLVNSFTPRSDYYCGISSNTALLNGQGALGLFGSRITRLYPKINKANSDEMWSQNNLWTGNVPGIYNLDYYTESTDKSNIFNRDDFTLVWNQSQQPNLILTFCVRLAWREDSGKTFKSWVINLEKLKCFSTFSSATNPTSPWSGSESPIITGGIIVPIDGRLPNISLYLPEMGGPLFKWDGWGFDDLNSNQIGIVARNEDAAINSENKKVRVACVTLYLYYPTFGSISNQ